MWTESGPRLPGAVAVLSLGLLLTAGLSAQEGQYRGKVLIDPDGTLAESASLSMQQLEQQLGALVDPYAKSSAGRQLARHYLQTGDYDKAEQYYRGALAAAGLAPVANREMLRELAGLYLLQQDYEAAAGALEQVLKFELKPEASDFLLLARARHSLGQHLRVVALLDQLQARGIALNTLQMQQAVALYYAAGAYSQCAAILRQLLAREPANADNWHQLAAVYLLLGKQQEALDLLTLALTKGIAFSERDTLLLADLQAAQNTPYAAASTLESALADGTVEATGINYRKLFEFWLQAREREKSISALTRAASATGDTVLYLHLAQLQMEEENWQAMLATVLHACSAQLEDRHVSRANLLLGISQLKLGQREAARRAFINASLIGGTGTQAGQWLKFMEAAPATEDELRRIVSPCYGSEDRQLRVSGVDAGDVQQERADASTTTRPRGEPDLEVKLVPAMRFLYSEEPLSLPEFAAGIRPLLIRMNLALTRGGGAADGSPQLLLGHPGVDPGQPLSPRLALPVRGAVRPGGRFRLLASPAFDCVWQPLPVGTGDLARHIDRLRERTLRAGYQLTGEVRLILATDDGTGFPLELQLGIMP